MKTQSVVPRSTARMCSKTPRCLAPAKRAGRELVECLILRPAAEVHTGDDDVECGSPPMAASGTSMGVAVESIWVYGWVMLEAFVFTTPGLAMDKVWLVNGNGTTSGQAVVPDFRTLIESPYYFISDHMEGRVVADTCEATRPSCMVPRQQIPSTALPCGSIVAVLRKGVPACATQMFPFAHFKHVSLQTPQRFVTVFVVIALIVIVNAFNAIIIAFIAIAFIVIAFIVIVNAFNAIVIAFIIIANSFNAIVIVMIGAWFTKQRPPKKADGSDDVDNIPDAGKIVIEKLEILWPINNGTTHSMSIATRSDVTRNPPHLKFLRRSAQATPTKTPVLTSRETTLAPRSPPSALAFTAARKSNGLTTSRKADVFGPTQSGLPRFCVEDNFAHSSGNEVHDPEEDLTPIHIPTARRQTTQIQTYLPLPPQILGQNEVISLVNIGEDVMNAEKALEEATERETSGGHLNEHLVTGISASRASPTNNRRAVPCLPHSNKRVHGRRTRSAGHRQQCKQDTPTHIASRNSFFSAFAGPCRSNLDLAGRTTRLLRRRRWLLLMKQGDDGTIYSRVPGPPVNGATPSSEGKTGRRRTCLDSSIEAAVIYGRLCENRFELHIFQGGPDICQRNFIGVLLPHVHLFRGAMGLGFFIMPKHPTPHRITAIAKLLELEILTACIVPRVPHRHYDAALKLEVWEDTQHVHERATQGVLSALQAFYSSHKSFVVQNRGREGVEVYNPGKRNEGICGNGKGGRNFRVRGTLRYSDVADSRAERLQVSDQETQDDGGRQPISYEDISIIPRRRSFLSALPRPVRQKSWVFAPADEWSTEFQRKQVNFTAGDRTGSEKFIHSTALSHQVPVAAASLHSQLRQRFGDEGPDLHGSASSRDIR
ncbi:hypothetical protein PR048_005826 [Dryococelus australis]|uniref:Uncharacterized protein n=1 Tax=Dryococelus australis TaxID=614101 RepID=A0ABQ9I9A0_9NEOP|nr:hypothetical protein PR048_005826 [Dryococelus australis]